MRLMAADGLRWFYAWALFSFLLIAGANRTIRTAT
jgi:hypothetical protein